MSDYNALKQALNTNGELMIKTDNGDKFELHKHNVTFNDSKKEIVVDGAVETFWIDANKVSYYWIHKETREEKS